MKQPSISVIMPVRNMQDFVLEAVNSIISQSFDDFEFIIVDDASEDATAEMLNTVKDDRIIRLKNNIPAGNYRSRNIGLEMSKGKYICVMDADDISHPDRFAKQFAFMESNPSVIASGTFFNALVGSNPLIPVQRLCPYPIIKVSLLWDTVFLHPSMIFRHDVITSHNLKYDERYYYAADYDLMVRLAHISEITNLPEYLVTYRRHEKQISTAGSRLQQIYRYQIQIRQLALLKIRPSIDETILHYQLLNDLPILKDEKTKAVAWCNKLMKKNRQHSVFDEEYFRMFLEKHLKSVKRKWI
jgi:glycosyltransferase involved in cell wall biosynthesis